MRSRSELVCPNAPIWMTADSVAPAAPKTITDWGSLRKSDLLNTAVGMWAKEREGGVGGQTSSASIRGMWIEKE